MNAVDMRIEELPAMDAPSDWSEFINGIGTGIAIVIIGVAIT